MHDYKLEIFWYKPRRSYHAVSRLEPSDNKKMDPSIIYTKFYHELDHWLQYYQGIVIVTRFWNIEPEFLKD